jgi:hypothetical protein
VDAAAEDREHRLIKPGRLYEHGGPEIGSTVSLNRDEMAGAEDTGWMPQWRIVSTVSLNRDEGMSAEDVAWENQHRLQTGRNMSGGDFGGRLDRVGFWAGVSFVFSFPCRFSFLSCYLFRLLVGVCFRS